MVITFLLFIKSKIQFFESKSQLSTSLSLRVLRCLSSQRYNFLKANHNVSFVVYNPHQVVYQVKDTIFWKQITTSIHSHPNYQMLFIKSKIQFFESKSQRNDWYVSRSHCCLSSQRYNFLKANHNLPSRGNVSAYVVYQVKDTIFWKQITTIFIEEKTYKMLFIKSKIQFFESKSQHFWPANLGVWRCLSSQRYNFLKANHNTQLYDLYHDVVVYQVKDTIFWKQITTSQSIFREEFSCLSSQRYNFLKANHNEGKKNVIGYLVVYQVKDTIFWKQITTSNTRFP